MHDHLYLYGPFAKKHQQISGISCFTTLDLLSKVQNAPIATKSQSNCIVYACKDHCSLIWCMPTDNTQDPTIYDIKWHTFQFLWRCLPVRPRFPVYRGTHSVHRHFQCTPLGSTGTRGAGILPGAWREPIHRRDRWDKGIGQTVEMIQSLSPQLLSPHILQETNNFSILIVCQNWKSLGNPLNAEH